MICNRKNLETTQRPKTIKYKLTVVYSLDVILKQSNEPKIWMNLSKMGWSKKFQTMIFGMKLSKITILRKDICI